ncbi:IS21-like element helper ATPase IstB [Planococcus sp. ISL-109]|uniref:IS21-like element helper ATPase IstB n=1 Tax=Planococcus sp. ISL-109 TaxID=2819166 RepID=UPI001BE62EE5|nr:IS21-like element helper ATPase IstB [Planococcus sp. ISL-109]MBT2584250.1 IS21-like element helper ATPase IstB [Planococcus sp. ISL-109]
MTAPVTALQEKFRALRLAETAKELPALLRNAESENWTYHELVHELVSYELACREEKTRERFMKWADFPFLKTLDDYRLDEQDALGERNFKQLRELSWVEECYTLILMGPPGVGKTHLSVGLGIEAVQRGYQVAFISMAELIYVLKTREYTNKSKTRYKRMMSSDLIIIDDVMYLTIDSAEANLFFQFIYQLYDHAAFILTSNKGPNEWGKFLGDATLTTAILDRLLHRSQIISYSDTDSLRMKHRKTLFPEINHQT